MTVVRNYDPEDDGPVRDGETLRVPLHLMDSDQRRIHEIIERALREADDGTAHDHAADLADARRAAADARERYIQRVTNAWRSPQPSPAPAPRSPPMRSDAKPISITPASLADARRLADEAWQRKQQRIRDAWKGGA